MSAVENRLAQGDAHNPRPLLNDLFSDKLPSNHSPVPRFSLFSSLTIEIRLAVWKCVMEHNRLIGIAINEYDDDNDGDNDSLLPGADSGIQSAPAYFSSNDLGRTISGANYCVSAITSHCPSVLLRVSHEARRAALEFYRVHIPCDPRNLDNFRSRFLYLNPDFDILHIQTEGTPEIFAHFVHDVKAYDPYGHGILNLAIGSQLANEIQLPMDPSQLAPLALLSFTSTLTNLKEVFFYHSVTVDARFMFNSLRMAQVRFNRSFPLHSQAETFELVTTDPRPIDDDLEKVAVGFDPRSTRCLWRDMEVAFQIQRAPGQRTAFQYIIDAATWQDGRPKRISCRADAIDFLRAEEGVWRAGFEKGGYYETWGGHVNPDTPASLERAPIPVVGFWMLPVDVFGDVPEGEFERQRWRVNVVVDLRSHRPQLGVFNFTPGK